MHDQSRSPVIASSRDEFDFNPNLRHAFPRMLCAVIVAGGVSLRTDLD
ncbi:MAG TPA: hypothetical protein VHZ53_11440 [Steroidobacteraceae bacterium]|nr:hypothetical protein [Steroidobacteraceae bacterium]